MSLNEDLVLNVNEVPEPQDIRNLPAFTLAMAAFPTPSGDLGFEFRCTFPEEFKHFELMSFIYLSRNKIEEIYNSALENAISAMMELNQEIGYETARANIEDYLRSTIQEGYTDGNESGIRTLEDEEE
jgi:hypothetical protein